VVSVNDVSTKIVNDFNRNLRRLLKREHPLNGNIRFNADKPNIPGMAGTPYLCLKVPCVFPANDNQNRGLFFGKLV
jgi:hypothetical protein